MLPFVSSIPQEHIELTDMIRSSEERLKFALCQQFFGRRVTGGKIHIILISGKFS